MMKDGYKRQVDLLLRVLPEAAAENCFALHGGTAINLFVRNLPRLSVDIDLTYLPIEERSETLANINAALGRIQAAVERIMPGVHITNRSDIGKLQISQTGAGIKLEVNMIGRGALGAPEVMPLCDRAQEEFNAFCAVRVVPAGQLFGGKICAALDRQHPRDLFDIKYLLQNEGFSEPIKGGFLLCLAAGSRPFHEILAPHLLDQRQALENQFSGMSEEEFDYREYESVREKLIQKIQQKLNPEDRHFILSLQDLKPDWDIYDFERFPAVKWKLSNLQRLRENNPQKYRQQSKALREALDSF